jgi:tellurite resistance protein TerC
MPIVDRRDFGGRFSVRENARRLATPLLAVLVVIASTDVLFALDSIPAIYGVTRDPFIVLAANVFALMGLRATYFVIVGALSRFQYLKYGLAAVLVFIGIKMCLSGVWHPPSWFSLPVVVVILGISAVASLVATARQGEESPEELTPPRPPTKVA